MKLVCVLDCQDPDSLADFWSEVLRYRRGPLDEPYVLLTPQEDSGPELLLQRVPEGKQGKNRMHLDLRVSDIYGERDRIVALGASVRSGEIVEGVSTGWSWPIQRRTSFVSFESRPQN